MNDRELLVNHWSGLSSHRNIRIAGFAGNSAPRRRLQRLKEALPATYNAHTDAYRVLNSVPEHVKLYVTALVECMRHLNSLPDTELSSIWRRPPKLPPSPPPSPSPLQGILPFEPCCCAHPRHVALWHSGLSGVFNPHRRWSASTCRIGIRAATPPVTTSLTVVSRKYGLQVACVRAPLGVVGCWT